MSLLPRTHWWVLAGDFGHADGALATRTVLWPRQGHFGHGKDTSATARTLRPRQGHFGHGKDTSATATAKIADKTGTNRRWGGQGSAGVAKVALGWPT